MSTKIACIFNPSKRRQAKAREALLRHCLALGLETPAFLPTTVGDPGGLQAEQALELGADLVVAMGGDGTIRNVSNVLTGSGVPLGVVPIGTANIFHLNAVGKRGSLDQSIRRAILGEDRAVDVGEVTLWHRDTDEPTHHLFLVVVGLGRDARTIHQVSDRLKRWIGPMAYFSAGLSEINKPAIEMSVSVDEKVLDADRAWSVIIGNCGIVPGGITILPNSSLFDGRLDLLHVAPSHVLQWFPIGMSGFTGHRMSTDGLTSMPASRVTVKPKHPIAVQIDGDVMHDVVQAEVAVHPHALIVRGAKAR